MPVSILRLVDLPAPFGPMNATRSPGSIEKDRWLTHRRVLRQVGYDSRSFLRACRFNCDLHLHGFAFAAQPA